MISSLNSSIYNSFYIKVDKSQIYVRGFENNSWIRCSTTFEINANKINQIVRLSQLSSKNAEINLFPVTGVTKKENPFDHPRLVYHNFELTEIFIRYLIKSLSRKWWKSINCVIFQLGYEPKGGLTDVEAKMLADSLEHCGAKQCYIIDPSYEMTEMQIEELYAEINKSRIKKPNKLGQKVLKKLSWPLELQ